LWATSAVLECNTTRSIVQNVIAVSINFQGIRKFKILDESWDNRYFFHSLALQNSFD